jgi:hypothetical protein
VRDDAWAPLKNVPRFVASYAGCCATVCVCVWVCVWATSGAFNVLPSLLLVSFGVDCKSTSETVSGYFARSCTAAAMLASKAARPKGMTAESQASRSACRAVGQIVVDAPPCVTPCQHIIKAGQGLDVYKLRKVSAAQHQTIMTTPDICKVIKCMKAPRVKCWGSPVT